MIVGSSVGQADVVRCLSGGLACFAINRLARRPMFGCCIVLGGVLVLLRRQWNLERSFLPPGMSRSVAPVVFE